MIYTVGHSTRSAETFLELLRAHRVAQIADIRAYPHSRRYPQFNRDTLAAWLNRNGVGYRHMPDLGGRRKPRRDSINTAWRHPAFRGYADYMQSDRFDGALEELLRFAAGGVTAVMCAEAVWWQCHRRLLSDALLVRHVPVQHILSAGEAKPHELSEFAREEQGRVTYRGLL